MSNDPGMTDPRSRTWLELGHMRKEIPGLFCSTRLPHAMITFHEYTRTSMWPETATGLKIAEFFMPKFERLAIDNNI